MQQEGIHVIYFEMFQNEVWAILSFLTSYISDIGSLKFDIQYHITYNNNNNNN